MQKTQGLRAAFASDDLYVPRFELIQQDFAVGRIVVDDKYAQTGERSCEAESPARRRILLRQLEFEPKCRAAPRLAVEFQRSAHHRDESFRDGEPEAGPTVTTRRRVVRLHARDAGPAATCQRAASVVYEVLRRSKDTSDVERHSRQHGEGLGTR